MYSQTRRTLSVAEVTKTKSFCSKTLGTMEQTERVSNIEGGSLISNLLPLDPYVLAGSFSFNFIKNPCKTVLLHSFIAFLRVG